MEKQGKEEAAIKREIIENEQSNPNHADSSDHWFDYEVKPEHPFLEIQIKTETSSQQTIPEARQEGIKAEPLELEEIFIKDEIIMTKPFSIETYLEHETCKATFSRKNHLQEHITTHTREIPYKCELCEKAFAIKKDLTTHMGYHNECESRKFKFLQKGHLQRHLEEKPFECKICEKKFAGVANLNRHIKMHTGEKPFQCETCCKSFTDKRYLEQHIKTHSGEKKYECKICKARFTLNGTLKQHLKIHTGERQRPFECSVCKREFTEAGTLRRHIRKHTEQSRLVQWFAGLHNPHA